MTTREPPAAGDTYTYERTFTPADVRLFGELSGDRQPIHTEPDEDGRLVVQGLLTATLPTKIGGDLEVVARAMDLEFHAPVYTGDAVTCEWRNETATEREDRYDITVAIECSTDDRLVLSGAVDGIIRKEDVD